MFKTVLVPADGSPLSAAAADAAIDYSCISEGMDISDSSQAFSDRCSTAQANVDKAAVGSYRGRMPAASS